jgi:activating signal cointegrator 1
MKALTLHQPYATAIALGCKRIETRGYRTHHRGFIAIHASAFMRPEYMEVLRTMPAEHAAKFIDAGYEVGGKPSLIKLPQGSIVAVARVSAVEPAECCWTTPAERHWGNYSAGRFCWLLSDIRCLATPIEARGNQGLWEWTPPADIRFAA